MRINHHVRQAACGTEHSVPVAVPPALSQRDRRGGALSRLFPIWFACCLWAFGATAAPREVGLEIFVSPTGDDENPGTKIQPFASLARAQKQVRALKRISSAAITVRLRAGTYYLPAPLVLTPEDSGAAGRPVTYAAYGEEQVTLSGGRRLTGEWKPYGNGIWMCVVPASAQGAIDFTQLFVNGRRQIRARFPNGDSASPNPAHYAQLAKADAWPHHRLQFDPSTFTQKRWTRPDEAVLHVFAANRWGNLQWPVAGVDWAKHALELGKGGWQLNEVYQGKDATGVRKGSSFFVENVFEELDEPGEWYWDRWHRTLYYQPTEGVDPRQVVFEYPVLKQLVEFRGTRTKPVRHVRITNVAFAHTTSTFLEPYEAPSLGDWSIHRAGAVFFEGAEECAVEECFFDGVGGNGVFLNRYNQRVRIAGNLFTEAGESAVCVVGQTRLNSNKTWRCPFCGGARAWDFDEPNVEHSTSCVIDNNLIHDIGVFGKQTAGVFLSLSERNVVSHNRIFNTPRAGICINDGLWGGHLIEFNDVHDTVRETGDHGPLNAWGRERSWCPHQSHGPAHHAAGDVKADAMHTTVIRNNRFRDYHGWGIDLDDGASNYLVRDNLCIGISLKLREGDFRTVENNIFINPANPVGIHVGFHNNSDRIVRNIIVTDTRYDNPEVDINFRREGGEGDFFNFIRPPSQGPWLKEIDYNLFYNASEHFRVNKMDLDKWRAKGFDLHSRYADPQFRNPKRMDFRVKPRSEAALVGFQNFAMDQFGLRPNFPKQWRDHEVLLPAKLQD